MRRKHLTIYFDGGGPNPGLSACAAVAFDDDGAEVGHLTYVIGQGTNNIAEYNGLLLACRLGHDLAATAVSLRGDSKLIVEQVLGRWKVKEESLRPLHARAVQLLRARAFGGWFEEVDLLHVPREQNTRADALVREVLGKTTGGTRTNWKGAGQRLADCVQEYLIGGADLPDLRIEAERYRKETGT